MKKEKYIVELVRPRGVTVSEMKRYIRDAVEAWGGSFRPPGAHGYEDEGDPLFGGVECKITKPKKEKLNTHMSS